MPSGEQDIQWLASQGIKNIISLTTRIEDISSFCEARGITWRPFFVPDFSVPKDPDEFDHLVKTIITQMDNENPCCVHCHAGIGRTGMLLACVVGKYLGIDGPEAVAKVKGNRPAIDTPEQIEFVTDYLK